MKVLCKKVFLKSSESQKMGSMCPIKLEYYKTWREDSSTISYGIEIVKKEYFRNSTNIEAKHIKNVMEDETGIEELIHILSQYHVTPVALKDVLEDLIKQTNFML